VTGRKQIIGRCGRSGKGTTCDVYHNRSKVMDRQCERSYRERRRSTGETDKDRTRIDPCKWQESMICRKTSSWYIPGAYSKVDRDKKGENEVQEKHSSLPPPWEVDWAANSTG
jgi:hypothetical protein